MEKHPADLFVGDKIQVIRRKRNITQSGLAEKLSMSRQQVQKYEVGETRVPVSVLFDIGKALNIGIDYFFAGISDIENVKQSISGVIPLQRSHPLNILLVEDSVSDSLLTRSAIDSSGYEANINSASNGIEALNILKNYQKVGVSRPDIVLLDLNIPKKDGFIVLKESKSDRLTKDIPIIIITNSTSTKEMQKVYSLGASGYLVKSFVPTDYFEKIYKVLSYWTSMVLPSM